MSSSSYSSFIPDYPQSDFLSQLAGIASQLGQQQYQWAQQQFANTSALTDQAVQNFLDASTSAKSLADNNLSRYTGIFQPEENQLVADANSYNSQPRIAFEMGKAESGAGQAMDANRINAERELQSFGIDPSSGRYAELEMAQNAQRGAAQAGAGQQAQYNTEATGRQLRGQAIQVGQQYPGQIVNALNARDQALSGAVNSKLANLNAGTAALSSADPFLNTGMALKYPPLGTKGGTNPGFKVNGGSNGSGSRGGGGGGGGPAGGYPGNINGPVGGQGSPGYSAHPISMGVNGNPNASITNIDPNSYGGGADPFSGDGAYNTYGQDVGSYTNYDPNGYNQFADPGAMDNFTSGYGSDQSFDPFNSYGQDYGAYTNYDPGFSGGGSSLDYSGDAGYNSGGQDFGSYGDTSYSSDPTSGFSNYDSGGGFDSGGGGDWSGDMGYAAGGGVAGGDPTTGGQVTQGMSPSGGQLQDDVPANLNEGEFVVPRDVAMWKGQEFFQKLIDQSRKARMGASAQGKPGPRQPGPPRFNSQAMGAQ